MTDSGRQGHPAADPPAAGRAESTTAGPSAGDPAAQRQADGPLDELVPIPVVLDRLRQAAAAADHDD
jgi:hypothetical protein